MICRARYFVPLTIIRQRREALIVTTKHRWAGAMDDDLGLTNWIADLGKAANVSATGAQGIP